MTNVSRVTIGVFLLGLLGWAYWPTLTSIREHWDSDPQYAQGYLIPVLALGVLALRRRAMPTSTQACCWWGVGLMLAAVVLRAVGTIYFLETLDALSLWPALAACLVCLGGWSLLGWALPGLTVLLFMVPLPFRVDMALSAPLRAIATQGSAALLQILGLPAVAEENIILVEEVRIGVVEACSGLGMMMTMFALSTAAALVCRRSWWEKAIIFLSAPPIAVAANILRIASTGLLYEIAGSSVADRYYHDIAGWAMMPVALLMLGLELKLLDCLVVEVEGRDVRGPYFHDTEKMTAAAQ